MHDAARNPLSALIRTIQDGRFLRVIFLAMLALSAGALVVDFQQLSAASPDGLPGSQRLEPAPLSLPQPGDQTRPYFPKTMPRAPNRGNPVLPGYSGPLDSKAVSGPMAFFEGAQGQFSAVGTITPGTAARLKEFLEDNDKRVGELHLHSPGGSVSDALAMARMVREAGITTVVPADGYCASSCPLVLSGGLYRKAGERSWVGVHQIYAPGVTTGTLQRGMAEAQSVSAACQQLLVDMRVDPQVWIYAMQTPSDQLFVFTPEQLRRFSLANRKGRTGRPTPRPVAEG
ncbi:MAG: hypothetical protein AAGF28_00090 [Pseudomonadota bacterium]